MKQVPCYIGFSLKVPELQSWNCSKVREQMVYFCLMKELEIELEREGGSVKLRSGHTILLSNCHYSEHFSPSSLKTDTLIKN